MDIFPLVSIIGAIAGMGFALHRLIARDIAALRADLRDVRADIRDIRGDVGGLRGDVASLRERMARLEGLFEGFARERRLDVPPAAEASQPDAAD